ncbi:MAG: hypothetical protein GXO69_06310 [Acidobacteria bacterium]|nr:hypothetical protein [Acidobacteriota bacterium]
MVPNPVYPEAFPQCRGLRMGLRQEVTRWKMMESSDAVGKKPGPIIKFFWGEK